MMVGRRGILGLGDALLSARDVGPLRLAETRRATGIEFLCFRQTKSKAGSMSSAPGNGSGSGGSKSRERERERTRDRDKERENSAVRG